KPDTVLLRPVEGLGHQWHVLGQLENFLQNLFILLAALGRKTGLKLVKRIVAPVGFWLCFGHRLSYLKFPYLKHENSNTLIKFYIIKQYVRLFIDIIQHIMYIIYSILKGK